MSDDHEKVEMRTFGVYHTPTKKSCHKIMVDDVTTSTTENNRTLQVASFFNNFKDECKKKGGFYIGTLEDYYDRIGLCIAIPIKDDSDTKIAEIAASGDYVNELGWLSGASQAFILSRFSHEKREPFADIVDT